MLKVQNIDVVYMKVIQVLKGISFELKEGQMVALLGANGAGKTTTLKAISGMLKTEDGEVTNGSIYFDGKRIDNLSPEDVAQLGISQVMEGRRVLEHLTVEENLFIGAYRRKDKKGVKEDIERVYNWFPRLKDLRTQISGYLSGGEQQMLVIGRAFMARPKLMLLDEPSLGLAPLVVKEIFQIIKRINEETNMSILLVEQNAKAALEVAQYGYVLENGRIVFGGPSSILKDNDMVREFYMGISSSGKKKGFRELKAYRRKKRWVF
ncbi:MAG: ABC transporter ATP-binding protein [Desulfobacterota bacterium]|nr:ABC transporter ATP-binding protein [Thermodesulfobacteriota bacterium]MDW8001302.1 ABC transporter ATP-binding protein [Deltaproteobacteria bacterium]